jgi:hypothetical protein
MIAFSEPNVYTRHTSVSPVILWQLFSRSGNHVVVFPSFDGGEYEGDCCLDVFLEMKAVSTSETSVNFYQTTRRNGIFVKLPAVELEGSS